MYRIVYLIVILALISGCYSGRLKVTNGQRVESIEEYPFQASFRYNSEHICGGSIVNKRYILTAAHCVHNYDSDRKLPEYSTIRVGSLSSLSGGKIYEVEELVHHPNWKKYDTTVPFYADIALIKLKEDIEFSEQIQPAKLPEKSDRLPDGSILTVLGWGQTFFGEGTSEEYLLSTKMQKYNIELCIKEYRDYLESTYPDRTIKYMNFPNYQMICLVGDGDFCFGDSGGPVVDENNVLVGVISFNMDCGTAAPVPSAVTAVKDWIMWIKDTSEIK